MSVNERRAVDVEWICRRGSRPWLPCGMACTVVGLALWPLSAAAQTPPPPPTPPAQGLLDCTPIIGQPLVKVPELVSGTDGSCAARSCSPTSRCAWRSAHRRDSAWCRGCRAPTRCASRNMCAPVSGVNAVPPPPPGPGPIRIRSRARPCGRASATSCSSRSSTRSDAGNFGDFDRSCRKRQQRDQAPAARRQQGNVIGGGYPEPPATTSRTACTDRAPATSISTAPTPTRTRPATTSSSRCGRRRRSTGGRP